MLMQQLMFMVRRRNQSQLSDKSVFPVPFRLIAVCAGEQAGKEKLALRGVP